MQRLSPGNGSGSGLLCAHAYKSGQSACFPFRALDDFLLARASSGELPLRLLFSGLLFPRSRRFLGGEDLNLCFRASLCQLSLDAT